jgi:hypothetical protein
MLIQAHKYPLFTFLLDSSVFVKRFSRSTEKEFERNIFLHLLFSGGLPANEAMQFWILSDTS